MTWVGEWTTKGLVGHSPTPNWGGRTLIAFRYWVHAVNAKSFHAASLIPHHCFIPIIHRAIIYFQRISTKSEKFTMTFSTNMIFLGRKSNFLELYKIKKIFIFQFHTI